MSALTRVAAPQRSDLVKARAFGSPLLALLIVATLLPLEASFYSGTFRLTIERLILIATAPYVLMTFVSSLRRVVASDVLVPLAAIWMVLANSVIQGFDRAATSTGILAIEFCLPYMIGRIAGRSESDIRGSIRFLCLAISLVGVSAILDSMADRYVLHEWASGLTGFDINIIPDHRLGLLRAAGTMEHPILLGTNCTIALLLSTAFVWPERWLTRLGCLVGLVSSFSSGPLGALLLGLVLLFYDKTFKTSRGRWALLVFAAALGVLGLFVIAKDPIGRFLSTFTFDADSAYYRLLIWHYGSLNVAGSPIFGIGLDAPWVRESWMTSSVDTFWLATAMTYGIPGLILTATGWLAPFVSNAPSKAGTESIGKLKLSFNIMMFAVVYIGFTVAFWGPTFIIINIIVGLRASLNALDSPPAPAPASRRVQNGMRSAV